MHVGVVVARRSARSASITARGFWVRGGVVQVDERLAVDLLVRGSGSRRARAPRRGRSRRGRAVLGASTWLALLHAAIPPAEAAEQATREARCADGAAVAMRSSDLRRRTPRVSRRARPRLADAARAQVEERVLVELADRRAVAALHVVGVDLELRACVSISRRATAAGCWFDCCASVFCASGRTMTLPLKTPRDLRRRATPLYSSRLRRAALRGRPRVAVDVLAPSRDGTARRASHSRPGRRARVDVVRAPGRRPRSTVATCSALPRSSRACGDDVERRVAFRAARL